MNEKTYHKTYLGEMPLKTEILVHYKDKRKPEWFEYFGFKWTADKKNQVPNKEGYLSDGFVIFGKPIKDTKKIIRKGRVVQIILIPETIDFIEVNE